MLLDLIRWPRRTKYRAARARPQGIQHHQLVIRARRQLLATGREAGGVDWSCMVTEGSKQATGALLLCRLVGRVNQGPKVPYLGFAILARGAQSSGCLVYVHREDPPPCIHESVPVRPLTSVLPDP